MRFSLFAWLTLVSAAAIRSDAHEPRSKAERLPCNNYVEFCDRKYSTITEVGAHNSPFVRESNAAANQYLEVEAQLDDGIRAVNAQMQFTADESNPEPHVCHTSCSMLDSGTVTEYLQRIVKWLDAHPREVVTIVLGNGNHSSVELYAPWIEKSGITKYAYVPERTGLAMDEWPTLGEMIQTGKRVVLYLDYDTDQTKYPWLIDQFPHLWETPYDPTDNNFPCNKDRPPDLSDDDARKRMYTLNHNLNVKVSLGSLLQDAELLIPAIPVLETTNAADGDHSLGKSARNCNKDWSHPPKILNVDFYNVGGAKDSGDVFKVAAEMNGVQYSRKCCGGEARPATSATKLSSGVRKLAHYSLLAILGFVIGNVSVHML